jgi:tRNA modification GTPase
MDQTIAAVATPLGEGGIGIVRISGPKAVEIADKIFRAQRGQRLQDLKSYRLSYGQIVDPATTRQIDEALALVMRAPRSYTGEDVVELQCHGGIIAVRAVLNLALSSGARLAEPGEFTKRAFLNGRLDLSQAEAVIDIIQAPTTLGLEVAVDQLEGSLSRRIKDIQGRLYGIVVEVEASIDFPEEDLPEVELQKLEEAMLVSYEGLDNLLTTADDGRILREGLKTVIAGKPNVGKSSLLNKLLDENRALVTDVPGTTRDTIEEVINLRGVPLRLIDTAGIRESEDVVERLGIARSLDLLQQADLILHVLDSSVALTAEDHQILEKTKNQKRVILVNKVDLKPVWDLSALGDLGDNPILEISLVDQGQELVDQLAETILTHVGSGSILSSAGSRALVTRTRHKQALTNAKQSLERALATFRAGLPLDLIAVDLYEALEQLGEITGETVRENVLDQIFAQFCIGK